jgi:hypothetical protein
MGYGWASDSEMSSSVCVDVVDHRHPDDHGLMGQCDVE